MLSNFSILLLPRLAGAGVDHLGPVAVKVQGR